MIWLILGVLLWWAAHGFKRLAPGLRQRMGDPAKGLVSLGLIAAIVLMVVGYRSAEPTYLWYLPWAIHLTDGVMVLAVALLFARYTPNHLRRLRHPMLTAVLLWSVSHLLANGDVPSLVLFSGLGLWSLATMALINRAEPVPDPYRGASLRGDLLLAVLTLVVYIVIVLIHGWIGPSPIP